MSDGKSHYEVLGLTTDATPDQVKKRFRELARKHHPDVNPDRPESHELFLRINQAYDVLSDAKRRAAYDLLLRDSARRAADQRAGAHGSAPNPPRSGAGARPGPSPGAAGRPAGRPAGPTPAQTRAQQEAEKRRQQAARQVQEARQAFQRGHLREAYRLCEETLRIGRFGAAHELMGDICARQGRTEEALEHYTVAAQMIPNNGLIMAKLNQVVARLRTTTARAYPEASAASQATPVSRLSYQLAVTCFGAAVILFLMIFGNGRKGDPIGVPFISAWTTYHLTFMAVSGGLAGAILSAAGWVRPVDHELLYPTVGSARHGIPIGVFLMVLGAVFVPMAFALYLIWAMQQQSVSRSVLMSFAATAMTTFGFFLLAPEGAHFQTLLFGGNVLFVTLLLGWFIGDLFRPAWAV